MRKLIKTDFKDTIYRFIRDSINYEIPKGRWHVLNHHIMVVVNKQSYKYNHTINETYLRGIIAFLITMYEFDFFSKIMIAVGLPYDEKQQAESYSSFTQTYILRWIPGMLTSRYIMARDFIRATTAKSSLVRYNLRYMRTTVLKLYHIPDLLILNSLDGMGAIVAKEAVIMRLPTIGLATNRSFPYKVGFTYFGQTSDFNYIKSFLYVLMYSMEMGRNLYLNNNNCGYLKGENFSEEFILKHGLPFLIKRDDLKDPFVHYKQFTIYNLFSNSKIEVVNHKKKNLFKLTMSKYYNMLNFKSGNKFSTRFHYIKCVLKNLNFTKKRPKKLKFKKK
jgi:hypothetical protein